MLLIFRKERTDKSMKMQHLSSFIGVVASFIASAFGGWSSAMTTLIIVMLLDFCTGLIVAGIYKKSPKTEYGGLASNIGFKGLCKKFMTLVFVLIGARLDLELGMDLIKNAVIFSFMTTEIISIIENAGVMGVPIPSVLLEAIELLKKKGDVGNGDKKITSK